MKSEDVMRHAKHPRMFSIMKLDIGAHQHDIWVCPQMMYPQTWFPDDHLGGDWAQMAMN